MSVHHQLRLNKKTKQYPPHHLQTISNQYYHRKYYQKHHQYKIDVHW